MHFVTHSTAATWKYYWHTNQIVDHTECKLLNTNSTSTEIPINQDMVEDSVPGNWHCVIGFTITILPSLQRIIMPSKCVKLLAKQHSVTSHKTWIFIPVFITVKIMGKLKYSEMWHCVVSWKCNDVWYNPTTSIIKMKVAGIDKNGTTCHSRRHHLYCYYHEKLNSHNGKHYLTKFWGQKNVKSINPFWIRSGVLKIQFFLDVILCQSVCYSQHLKGP